MKKKKNSKETSQIEREDSLELTGTVEEALPGTLFKVKTTTGQTVLATLSGKLRQNHIVVLPGDDVTVEVSIYDTTRGRISWRR
jgi:translation initiation factor IF-1